MYRFIRWSPTAYTPSNRLQAVRIVRHLQRERVAVEARLWLLAIKADASVTRSRIKRLCWA